MSQILVYFFLAIGLSMDAFSLALAYGTNKPPFKKCLITSLFVGLFHFFMPLLGSTIGYMFTKKITLNTNLFVALIFFLLALEMFLSRKEEQKEFITSFLSIIFFSFSVSVDSFSVGIALGITNSFVLLASILFSIVSAFFTLLGLILGKKLYEKYGEKATILGILILLLLALKYLFFN